MVEQFVGTWTTASSENFEEFLKEMGIGLPMRKAASIAKPDMIISVDDQGMITLKMKCSMKTKEIQFKLKEHFDGTRIDDKMTTNIVTLENGKLVQKQTCGGKVTTFEREIVNEQLVMTCKTGDVVAKRTFRK